MKEFQGLIAFQWPHGSLGISRVDSLVDSSSSSVGCTERARLI
jgi:hypothetical protein